MHIKIGTRGSQLALAQSEAVKAAILTQKLVSDVELVKIKTLGDRKQGTPQASQSDKKDWVIDLDTAIVDSSIDLAVHSGKDIPVEIEKGTILIPVLRRANPFDSFIGRLTADGQTRMRLADLPLGAKVGTASLRRRAHLLRFRPDLQVIEHRGNVPTRLQKMDDSDDIMGIVLAQAGIDRLGLSHLQTETFTLDKMIPAVNQAILIAQCRADDQLVIELLQQISDPHTAAIWHAERAVAEVLNGDCKSAVSIFAQCDANEIELVSAVMSPCGNDYVQVKQSSSMQDARQLGLNVGQALIAQGADRILKEAASAIGVKP